MHAHIIRRFRREVRSREDLKPNTVVMLNDDPRREGNTRVAEMLLRQVFGDRITVVRGPEGMVCGSREEAVAERLREYTRQEPCVRVLLESVSVEEIESLLGDEGVDGVTVFVPDSAEVRFLERLAREYPDVLYGL